MSLYSAIAGRGPTGFGYGSTAEDVTAGLDLTGKTILITGCNSGLGQESARVLASRGARIVGLARSEDKAAQALAPFGSGHVPVACELSEPGSVRGAVEKVKGIGPIDVLMCNAGIMALPKLSQKYGYELQFLTNHIGHSILVLGLMDHLTDDARVVMLTSAAHFMSKSNGIDFEDLSGERRYDAWRNYGQAKLANLLFAKHLAKRWEGTKRTANGVHPGVIHTNLGRNANPLVNIGYAIGSPLFLKNTPQGAATQCYVAVHPKAAGISGRYWVDSNVGKESAQARDAALAERLWVETERIVASVG